MLNSRIQSAAARGFSLVEMLVGMAAGVILIGSVIGLVVANLQNNAATVKGMRLTQESRAIVEIITRELRRARYNGNAMSQIGTGVSPTTFSTMTLASSSCLKYAYDADDDGAADSGEFRMFSRSTVSGRGVLRYGRFATAAALAGASCTTGGSAISSDDIDLTTLTFTVTTARIDFSVALSATVDGTITSTRTTAATVMRRAGSI